MTKPIVNVSALISALNARGRAYTDARNAVVAHQLATGASQAEIKRETGLDAGDISRIHKVLKNNTKAMNAAKRLNVTSIDVDAFETLKAASTLGATYLRRAKGAPAAPKGATDKGATDKGEADKGATDKGAGIPESIDLPASVFNVFSTLSDRDATALWDAIQTAHTAARVEYKRAQAGKGQRVA